MSKSLVMDHLPIESDGITPFNRPASPKIDVIPNKQPLPELTTRPTPMQDVFIGNNNMLTHKTFDSSRQVMPINSSIQSLPIKTLQETPQAKYTTIPEKVSIVSAQAADVITHLKSCARMSTTTKNLLDIDKLHIKESTYLNKALNQVKYEIQQVIFEKDGWFSRGGKFIGLRSHKDVEKIKTIIANFEKTVEAWKTNTELIRQDIVHDKTRTSPLFLKDEPYNRHWDFIIHENDFNRDLFRMRNLMERQDFQAACEIVENYKGRIPYTKEGWIADTPEFREHAKLQTFYQQEYSRYQKEMVNDVNHPENTINFDLLKTLEGVDPNLGLDFVSSAKQTLTDSTYDTKLFAELMRDEQLGPILREAFGKETFITADYSIKQPSLYEQCDTFLKDYHQACNQVQQVALNEESTLKKYGIIGNTEIHKKAIEFGQAFLHPQETAQEIWHGLENIAKFCHRFAEIDTHLEFGELDLARQKSQELTQGISATFDALNALSHEEKFKLIIDFFFDWKVGNKLFDQAFNIAASLKNVAKEIATITSKLELVPEQAQKLAVLSKTCEKRAVQIEEFAQTIHTYEKTFGELVRVTADVEEVIQLEASLPKLRSLFDQTRKGFAEFGNKYIKIPYAHILGPEFKMTKNGLELKGFHHDYLNALEKSGIVKITNKVIHEHGFYKADVLFNGKLYRDKTFFPSHWSREKVIAKIMEAYDNFKANGFITELRPDNKFFIESYINESIKIETYLTKKGHITSSYPSL